jgi:ATP-dependent DNA helicase RecQ
MFFLGGRYPGKDEITEVYESLARLRADEKAVDISTLRESASGVPPKKARVILSAMKDMKLVRELRGAKFKLLKTGLSGEELERLAGQYEEKSGKDRRKLEQMMLYAQSGSCRWKVLLEYFGDESREPGGEQCGVCDNCVSPPEEQIQPPRPSHSLGWLDL